MWLCYSSSSLAQQFEIADRKEIHCTPTACCAVLSTRGLEFIRHASEKAEKEEKEKHKQKI